MANLANIEDTLGTVLGYTVGAADGGLNLSGGPSDSGSSGGGSNANGGGASGSNSGGGGSNANGGGASNSGGGASGSNGGGAAGSNSANSSGSSGLTGTAIDSSLRPSTIGGAAGAPWLIADPREEHYHTSGSYKPSFQQGAITFWRWMSDDYMSNVEQLTVWVGQRGGSSSTSRNSATAPNSGTDNPLLAVRAAWAPVVKDIPRIAGPNTPFDPGTLRGVNHALQGVGEWAETLFTELDDDVSKLDTKAADFAGSAAAAFRDQVNAARRGVQGVLDQSKKWFDPVGKAVTSAHNFVNQLALDNDHWSGRNGPGETRGTIGGPPGVWTDPYALIVAMFDGAVVYSTPGNDPNYNHSGGLWETGTLRGERGEINKNLWREMYIRFPEWTGITGEFAVLRQPSWLAVDTALRAQWAKKVENSFAPSLKIANEMIGAFGSAAAAITLTRMPPASKTPDPSGNGDNTNLNNDLNDLNNNLNNDISDLNNNLNSDLNSLAGGIGDGLNGLNDNLNGLGSGIGDGLNGLNSNLNGLGSGIGDGLNGLNSNLNSLGSGIGDGLNGLGNGLTGLDTNLGNGLNSLAGGVGNGVGNNLGSGVGSGLDNNLGSGVGSGLGSGVGSGVGNNLGSGVGSGLDNGVGSGVGSNLDNGVGSDMSGLAGPGAAGGADSLTAEPRTLGDLSPDQLGELSSSGALDNVPVTPAQLNQLRQDGLLGPDATGITSLGDLSPAQLNDLSKTGMLNSVPVTPSQLDSLRQAGLLSPNATTGLGTTGLGTTGLGTTGGGTTGLSGLGPNGTAPGQQTPKTLFPTPVDGLNVTAPDPHTLAAASGVRVGNIQQPMAKAVPGDVAAGFGTSGVTLPGAQPLAAVGSSVLGRDGTAGLSGSGTATGSAGAGEMPMMPMGGMGGMGGGQGQSKDRHRNTWLTEDEDVWGTDPECAPAVIGRGDASTEDESGNPAGPVLVPPARDRGRVRRGR